MKNFYNKIKTFILSHKWWSGVIVVAIIFVGYYGVSAMLSTSGDPSYVTSLATTGSVVSSVTGTGQVSTSDQVDIKPKVSGDVTWINVQAGDKVKAGQALMGIDNTDAQQAVTSAEQSLVTSQLQYQKDSASAPIDYQNTVDDLATAKEDLATTFNDTFNTLSNTYLDLPTVMTGTQNILYGYDLNPSGGQWNVDLLVSMFNDKQDSIAEIKSFAQSAEDDYKTASADYDTSVLAYKQITRASPDQDIETSLNQSIDTTTSIAQAIQSELNFLGLITDTAQTYNMKLPGTLTTMQTNARNYLSTVNGDLSNLLSQKKTIATGKQTITTDQQNITLLQVGNSDGGNPISLQIEKNNLASQEQNLAQLKNNLSDYTIVTPFDGIISAVDVQKGDTASGAVASIISNQTLAEITLNEIDAAKVSVGQKATLTFAALPNVTVAGTVDEIDTVGTVSQGVVTYNVKIGFDTQDSGVKPGMSVSAAIVTAIDQNVVVVPSSSVKTSGGVSYVQVFNPPLAGSSGSSGAISKIAPTNQVVTTGLSDGSNTEITSGLKVGDQVVTRTIAGSGAKTTTTSATPSLLGGSAAGRAGGGGGFGGGVRIGG